MIRPGDPSSLLTERRRARALHDLRSRGAIDVLVVGGGITGVGVALDAAARGLATVLVERHDLAHGTSRWSSKLVHGGLRYLASGAVDVALESARERHILMTRVAPHLIRALPTLIPDYGGADQRLNRVGLMAGDGLRAAAGSERALLPRSRAVTADTAMAMAPALTRTGLQGAAVGWDGQLEDDARLVVAVARTAAAYGATILTRVAAEQVFAHGAVLRDEQGTFEVRADNVICATGVWTTELLESVRLAPSLGSHIIVPNALLGDPRASLTLPVPGEKARFVFAMPQPDGLTYIGITDQPVTSIESVPTAPDSDIAWLCDRISSALATPITVADVVGSYAGLRPLLPDSHDSSADISRRHLVRRVDDGVFVVTGGKLTTYRQMAEDAVDQVTARSCQTRQIALVGAPGNSRSNDRLQRRFGSEAPLLRQWVERDPELGAPIGAGPELGVEIAWARRAEGALSVDDALDRRTRVGLVPAWREMARGRATQIWESVDPGSGSALGG